MSNRKPYDQPVSAELVDVNNKVRLTDGDLCTVGTERQAFNVKIVAFRTQVGLCRELFLLLHQAAVEQGDLVRTAQTDGQLIQRR